MLTLDAKRTALVLIDVQKGTLGFNLSPYTPADVVAAAAKLDRLVDQRVRLRGAAGGERARGRKHQREKQNVTTS